VLSEERTALQGLTKDLEYDLVHLSNSPDSQEEWFKAIQESLGNARRARPNEVKQGKADPIWNLLEDFLYSVEWDEDRGDTAPTMRRFSRLLQPVRDYRTQKCSHGMRGTLLGRSMKP